MRNCLAVLGIVLFSAAAVAQAQPLTSAPATGLVLKTTPICGPVQNTGVRRAGGSTCAQAQFAVQGVLVTAAGCGTCGFCTQYFTYGACEVIQGGYSVPGNLKYSCKICELD
jgi:hypothetical protein